MIGSLDEVIERARVREAAGVFHSYHALDAAADDLLRAGLDRADIDIIGDLREVHARLGHVYVAPEELPDVPLVPRSPYAAREEAAAAISVVAGVLACVGGFAVAYGVVVSDGRTALAFGAAAVAALAAGGLAAALAARHLGRKPPPGLEWLAPERGIVVWVRIRSPEHEGVAQEILRSHGAKAVRIHEVEIDKRIADLPLSSLRPDPWLGRERLGDA
jgi:hypothetical protein